MIKTQKELKGSYESNKDIADKVLTIANRIQGLLINEADIIIVQAYEEEIFDAYSGFPKPKRPEGILPDIDTILWQKGV